MTFLPAPAAAALPSAAARRSSTSSRAMRSSATALNTSPADGTSDIPVISTGTEGPASVTRSPLVVRHHAHTADSGAGNDDVAGVERAVLHENGHDRAAALVETRFHDRAACAGRFGLALSSHDLGQQHEIFQQVVDALRRSLRRSGRRSYRRPTLRGRDRIR